MQSLVFVTCASCLTEVNPLLLTLYAGKMDMSMSDETLVLMAGTFRLRVPFLFLFYNQKTQFSDGGEHKRLNQKVSDFFKNSFSPKVSKLQ